MDFNLPQADFGFVNLHSEVGRYGSSDLGSPFKGGRWIGVLNKVGLGSAELEEGCVTGKSGWNRGQENRR